MQAFNAVSFPQAAPAHIKRACPLQDRPSSGLGSARCLVGTAADAEVGETTAAHGGGRVEVTAVKEQRRGQQGLDAVEVGIAELVPFRHHQQSLGTIAHAVLVVHDLHQGVVLEDTVTILNNFTSSYGANAVAAMGIAQKINQVPFYIANGLSQGIMPLISYNYASDNIKRMKHTLTFAAKISVTGLVLVSIAYSFFAGDLITMFMDNPEIVEMGSRFLRGFCLGLPFLCVDFLAVGVFQATGLGRTALVFAILRKIVLEIPALFILNHFFPLYGLAYAQFTAELVLSIAAVIILVKLFRKLELEKADRDAQKA